MKKVLFVVLMFLAPQAFSGGDVFSKYNGIAKLEKHFVKVETQVASTSSTTAEKLISFKLCSNENNNDCKILGDIEWYRLSYFISKIQNRKNVSALGGAAGGAAGVVIALTLLFSAPPGWPFAIGYLVGVVGGGTAGYLSTDALIANNINSSKLIGDVEFFTDLSIYDYANKLDSELRALPTEARVSGI